MAEKQIRNIEFLYFLVKSTIYKAKRVQVYSDNDNWRYYFVGKHYKTSGSHKFFLLL